MSAGVVSPVSHSAASSTKAGVQGDEHRDPDLGAQAAQDHLQCLHPAQRGTDHQGAVAGAARHVGGLLRRHGGIVPGTDA